MSEVFEPKPRWPGAPPLCIAENLFAFPSQAAISAFVERNCPGVDVEQTWECKACGQWHFRSRTGHADLPSGYVAPTMPVPKQTSASSSSDPMLPKSQRPETHHPIKLPKRIKLKQGSLL